MVKHVLCPIRPRLKANCLVWFMAPSKQLKIVKPDSSITQLRMLSHSNTYSGCSYVAAMQFTHFFHFQQWQRRQRLLHQMPPYNHYRYYQSSLALDNVSWCHQAHRPTRLCVGCCFLFCQRQKSSCNGSLTRVLAKEDLSCDDSEAESANLPQRKQRWRLIYFSNIS